MTCDAEPPIRNDRQYLINRLPYPLQEFRFGDPRSAVRAKLEVMADALDPIGKRLHSAV